jgi:hypothetical protein
MTHLPQTNRSWDLAQLGIHPLFSGLPTPQSIVLSHFLRLPLHALVHPQAERRDDAACHVACQSLCVLFVTVILFSEVSKGKRQRRLKGQLTPGQLILQFADKLLYLPRPSIVPTFVQKRLQCWKYDQTNIKLDLVTLQNKKGCD